MNQAQIKLVKDVARDLISNNGFTTTLEIKTELRTLAPSLKWFQSDVSDIMADALIDGSIPGLDFDDTGRFRLYKIRNSGTQSPRSAQPQRSFQSGHSGKISTPSQVTSPAPQPTPTNTASSGSTRTRTEIVDLMRNSKGRFFTVVFTKKDGSERTMNGNVKASNFMDGLGFINFRESNGQFRRVNPRTIKEISIGGQTYKAR